MEKARNIVFILIFALIVCSVFEYKAFSAATDTDVRTRSTLEGRAYQQMPEMDVEAVSSGTFQDEFEQYVADSIPGRNTILLTNANIQRTVIETANVPFSYSVYPTFFGSSYVENPTAKTVYEKNWVVTSQIQSDLDKATDVYADLIARHPDVNWSYYLVDRTSSSLGNPTHGLESNPADYEFYRTEFLDKLPSSCQVIDGSYPDEKEFTQTRFLTDHHWNVKGAIDAYEAIATQLGRSPIQFGDVYVAYKGPFYGSAARTGLTLDFSDEILDVNYDASDLAVKVDGEEKSASFLCYSLGDADKQYKKSSKFGNSYAEYFHDDKAFIEITNPQAEEGSLLIIGDSYTNCMERFFAENYQKVYVLDPRKYQGTVDDFIEEHDNIEDALFLMGNTNVATNETISRLL